MDEKALKTGKKLTILKLSATKPFLKKFLTVPYITNRKTGKVVVQHQHAFEPTIFIASNADESVAAYTLEEAGINE